MNGLTEQRATRPSVRRNSAKKSRNVADFDTGSNRDMEARASAQAPGPTPEALGRTVEREVIPRLIFAHRPQPAANDGADRVDVAEVVEFTQLIATRELAEAQARIESKRAQGTSLETLYLKLLIPVARRLSELWEADLCNYEDIAMGMLHLQQVLHGLSPAFSTEFQCRSRGRKALLLSAPAEQCMLGVFMVTDFYRCVASEFFHRAGWEVWRAPPRARAQLLGILSSQWFDVIDVSASCEARLPSLLADIEEMRKASRNSHVGVVVGGPVFNDHPEFASAVGADASATDPRDTLAQAELLVAQPARARRTRRG